MKMCPHCAEDIKEQAKVCPHCTRDLTIPELQRVEEIPNSPTVGEVGAIIQDLGLEGAAKHYGIDYLKITSIKKQYNISATTTPKTPPPQPRSAIPTVSVTQPSSKPQIQRVIVTDINMSFSSMIEFMVKWAIASIPAIIILSIIIFATLALLTAFISPFGR
jgi:hypothetical protein